MQWFRLSRSFHCLGMTKYFRLREQCRTFSKEENIETGLPTADIPEIQTSKIQPAVGEFKNPITAVKNELNAYKDGKFSVDHLGPPIPREADVVIVGGGIIGSSVAYWIRQRLPINVMVIEKDPTYMQASTPLSAGGLRQQFSLPENIQMSLFTAQFLRTSRQSLLVDEDEPPDVKFNPQGYLFLAMEKSEKTMVENHKIQINEGAKVSLLKAEKLKSKFPWLNTDGLTLGSLGFENEGWLDPWCFLHAVRSKATALGVRYVKGTAVGFKSDEQVLRDERGLPSKRSRLKSILVQHEDGNIYPVSFASVVNCAGAWSGRIGQMAGIGSKDATGALRIPIPVVPRKRYVYVVHCPDGPGLEMPLVIDPSGVYVRREDLHGNYICGASPDPDSEPSTDNLEVDYEYFHEKVWPVLAARIPVFEKLKLKSAWAGFYDYNYLDQNLIIGNHPYHRNFFMATGSSGHGLQHAIAIGRAITELMFDSDYQTIDLSRFSFDRVLDDEPLYEENIV